MKELTKTISFNMPIKDINGNDIISRPDDIVSKLLEVINPILNKTNENEQEKIDMYDKIKKDGIELSQASTIITQAGLLRMHLLNSVGEKEVKYEEVMLRGRLGMELITNPEKILLTSNELKIIKDAVLKFKVSFAMQYQILSNLEEDTKI